VSRVVLALAHCEETLRAAALGQGSFRFSRRAAVAAQADIELTPVWRDDAAVIELRYAREE
jgi:hypothetical protein